MFRQIQKRALATSSQLSNLVELTINGKTVKVPPGTTVLKAAEEIGVQIPRFCYHERLAIAGNCRMCLVDMVGGPKPIASCAYPVMNGMKIETDSDRAKKAREGVMEFLLINHPLDCPVCDQGGECDLQDQSYAFGSDRSRFKEAKRAVQDKELGPLVKTVMTRCIQCTRCVRFSHQIAGNPSLGMSGRGNDAQIGTYVDLKGMIGSELSGNLIDVCPVGALTSKPYAFQGRPWENRKCETICALDAVGSNIQVSTRAGDLLRVIPKIHDGINEEWIGDKTRFSYDGLKRQRLTQPLTKRSGKFQATHWEDCLEEVATLVAECRGDQVGAVAGAQTDAETLMAMKDFLAVNGSNHAYTEQAFHGDVTNRANYIFNNSIEGIEEADLIILVGSNPRYEATIVNARIRKAWLHNETDVAVIGNSDLNLTYDHDHLGDDVATIDALISGKHQYSAKLKAAKNPMVIVGADAVDNEMGGDLLNKVQQLCSAYKADYNFLHSRAGQVGALDLGYNGSNQADLSNCKVIFNLGADEGKFTKQEGQKVIYIGTHGDNGAKEADIILPAAAYTEKHATYVNTEGRAQQTRPAVHPPGAARVDWQIVRALSEIFSEVADIEATLPYDSLDEIRERIDNYNPAVVNYDVCNANPYVPENVAASDNSAVGKISVALPEFADYFMTCPITRASQVMANCIKSAGEMDVNQQYIEGEASQ